MKYITASTEVVLTTVGGVTKRLKIVLLYHDEREVLLVDCRLPYLVEHKWLWWERAHFAISRWLRRQRSIKGGCWCMEGLRWIG